VTIKLKRAYEAPDEGDGYRVLVDRLWPRGLRKQDARIDLWLQRIAPSTELRQWYGHDVDKWAEFRRRYLGELSEHQELLELLGDIERHRKTVTLIFGARDQTHNEATVLLEALKEHSDE
jgi:uncharacterized protein YeaO (DUF488 family)